MRFSILFILILIVVSGFIAYFGDILGRRLGKKRLTLFNLRPRYTAIVVTTITGMLISALAVAALLSVDSRFREVMREGERIFEKNLQLQIRSRELTRTNRSLLARSADLQKQVADRQKELQEARKAVADARRARDSAARAVEQLRKDIRARQQEIAAQKQDIELLRGRKLAVEDELDTRTEQLESIRQDLLDKQKELSRATEALAAANTDLAAAQNRLRDVQARLAAKVSELEAKQKELISEQTMRRHFEKQAFELRSGELVMRQGDEIIRGTVSPKQPLFGIRADLVSLLKKASDIAEQRGAVQGDNGRAVTVVFRSPDGRTVETDESECLRLAAEAIAPARTDALVQVVCATNTVAGEQAIVELRLYVNNRIYAKDDLIAVGRIDGRLSEGRVLLSLINFLQQDVAEAAVRKGIVPVPNYDPKQSMGVNPQRQLQGLLDVVENIRALDSKAEVRVYASADVYAIGPLNMDNMRFVVARLN